jgi:hypothetical protein
MVFVVRRFIVVLVYSHCFSSRDRNAAGEEREWRLVSIHSVEGIGLYVVSLYSSTCCWSASYPEMSLTGVQTELLLSVRSRSFSVSSPSNPLHSSVSFPSYSEHSFLCICETAVVGDTSGVVGGCAVLGGGAA